MKNTLNLKTTIRISDMAFPNKKAALLQILDKAAKTSFRGFVLEGDELINDTKQFLIEISPVFEENGSRGGWLITGEEITPEE